MCTPHKILEVVGLQIREEKTLKVPRFQSAWNILIIFFLYAETYLQDLTNDVVKRDLWLTSLPIQFVKITIPCKRLNYIYYLWLADRYWQDLTNEIDKCNLV